jgi:hypothetical protein
MRANIKKIKAENNKINKLRYKKKKDPELFQLNADDLELLHAQNEKPFFPPSILVALPKKLLQMPRLRLYLTQVRGICS